MKNFLVSIICLIIFLGFGRLSYAYDLDVQCDDTKCNISSHDPIFKGDDMWTPGKSVEKSIFVKNTGESEKEIYLRIKTNESTGELDEHMLISLMKQGAGSPIWTGILKELIEDETVLIEDFSKDEQIELIISAQMDSAASNELQGGSSVFDFGFGFERDLSDDNDSEDSSDNNNSDTNSNEGNNSQNTVGQILEGIATSIFGGQTQAAVQEQGDVAGESSEEKSDRSEVMGISDECADSNWWILVLVAQALISIMYFIKKISVRISTLINFVGVILASAFIYFLFCISWPIIISLGIFAVPQIIINRKFLAKKLSFK